VAVGVKQVIALPSRVISDRTLTSEDEGAAWLFVGEPTHGRVGGGFLYTNRDTISIGLVATLSHLAGADVPVYQMLEDFKEHPAVAPIIAGGDVVEHSGHLVAEGGYDTIPQLIGDGVLLVGESAMMCINAGYTVRGMDLAIAAGMHAGQAAAAALDAGDTSAQALAPYRQALEDSFVLQDMRTLRRFPAFMENTPRLFDTYSDVAAQVMRQLFLSDGTPVRPLLKTVPPIIKQVGYFKVAGDLLRGVRAL
jgi:electron transfer flavoprotein-quinone oxidoreductase